MRLNKLLYIFYGFLLGFCFSLFALTIEDFFHSVMLRDSVTELHHFLFPLGLGIIGGLFGFLYERNSRSKRLAEEMLLQKNKNLSILLSVSQEFVLSLDLSSVLQTVIEQATNLINLDTGAIYLHEDELLYLGATTPPLPPGFPDEFRKASLKDHSHIQKALNSGNPVSVADSSKESFTQEEKIICEQRGLLSILYIPLIIDKKAVGTLILGTIKEHRIFTSAEIDMFRTISTPAALVIQNAKLYSESMRFSKELQKQNETILLMNEDLKQGYSQIKRMNLTLQEAKESAEKSEKLKTVFLHNMSHEVRTPLNAISGFSQLLQGQELSVDQILKYSNLISTSSDKLLRIVTDILEVSEIQTKDVAIFENEFDFIPFANFLIAEFDAEISKNKIKFSTVFSPQAAEFWIKADDYKLHKIYFHLIDNAIKFTKNGSVDVYFNLKKEAIEFIVQDSGIGIRKELHEEIFEPFQQIEPGSGNLYVGNGLGLTIVKAYTDLLSGELSLQSEPGKGTRIVIEIPMKMTASKKLSAPLVIPKPKRSGTILIVEDEESNYDYLKEIVSDFYSRILYASDGKQAVDICKEEKEINVILMDIKMPVMDGVIAATQIKKFRPEIPIIAQSAYATPELSVNFGENIFDDYLSKPIKRKDLIAKLHNLDSKSAFLDRDS